MIEKYALPDDQIEDKKVETKDMLFATLDTTVRKISPQDITRFFFRILLDLSINCRTIFIEAFRSTLEEAREADVLIQVIDYSDENFMDHMEVTRKTLAELGAGEIPMIYVYNKADLGTGNETVSSFNDNLPRVGQDKIYMSAIDGTGLMSL